MLRLVALFWLLLVPAALAGPLPREVIEPLIVPPYALGEMLDENGIWALLNSGGAEAGYVFETAVMAPLPGFSGAPIDMLVMLDREGRFIDVRLLEHNEPIFVSGLGEAPLHRFLEQYRGHSINEPAGGGQCLWHRRCGQRSGLSGRRDQGHGLGPHRP